MIRCLEGITVVDLSATVSGSFCSSLLAEHGATVYTLTSMIEDVVERTEVTAREAWRSSIARNKIVFDDAASTSPEFLAACQACDVLIAADTARAFDASPLAGLFRRPAEMEAPLRMFLLSPGADRPELWSGSIDEAGIYAASGLAALTGQSDEEPVLPEAPIAESLAGTMAALCIVSELWASRRGARPGIDIEFAIHEAIQRMIEWQLPVAALTGVAELRNGNSFPLNAGISNSHLTADGRFIAISAANQVVANRLLKMIGGDELALDPRFQDEAARRHNMTALYSVIDEWIGQRTAEQVLEAADAADVVAGVIYEQADILTHPQVTARGNLAKSAVLEALFVRPTPRITGVR
ncbi:CoA transferase [Achromobacter spanius]|uniref:CoA transferase n=1 Tax=Achromobacter spanius TaxID=217203 RepID=UPI0036EC9678